MVFFEDRREAGQLLAAQLEHLARRTDVVVLGIPRGGVVVADEIARALSAPLDVLITHKLGAPFNSELAVGAVASDGTVFLDYALIRELGLPVESLWREREKQVAEIARRAELYRQGQPPLALTGKTAILVDDGVATGSTTMAGLRALAHQNPACRILAVPVAPKASAQLLAHECEELVLLDMPEPFIAVGRFYEYFGQVDDDEVVEILRAARERTEKA